MTQHIHSKKLTTIKRHSTLIHVNDLLKIKKTHKELLTENV